MKPSDFYIGLVEFFAILLPGAVLVYVFHQWGANLLANTLFITVKPGAQSWAVFLVTSYIIGHALHHLGSMLDLLYDWAYVRHGKRRAGPDWMLRRTKEIVARQLGRDCGITNHFSWAGSFVRHNSSAARAELERAGAESKFFRSLTLVLALIAARFLYMSQHAAGLVTLAFALASLLRFFNLRWKGSQLTYEYFILLASRLGDGK